MNRTNNREVVGGWFDWFDDLSSSESQTQSALAQAFSAQDRLQGIDVPADDTYKLGPFRANIPGAVLAVGVGALVVHLLYSRR
jgi:hypothetical protein